jgi:hypothetical protein
MLILGFAMVACVVGFSAKASTDIIYKDDKVTVTETLHSYIPFSVHVGVSDVISITVFGKRYKDVRGTAPYYLEIPGTNLILFVTGPDHNGSGKAVVHLVNTGTKAEVHFPAYDSHIGSNICLPEKQAEFEKVESVTTNELVISAGFLDRRYHYYLDLKKPAFEKEVGDSYVWPQGKAH